MKKYTLIFLSFLLVFSQVFGFMPFVDIGVAEAASDDVREVYDVVAVVVHKDLFADGTVYQGINEPEYLEYLVGYDTIESRIERYALDIQRDNPGTIAKILTYDPDSETLLDVVSALENIYKNGLDGYDSRLRGVVLVGQIPLPIVNKKGNRFISMFPLTDFDEKAYVFDPLKESFDRVPEVTFPKPEIWHGVIREPILDDSADVSYLERDVVAEFFDKNHLYHEDVEGYADFEKKLFYADLVNEEKRVNEEMLKNYQRYLANLDDLAYFRYNKKWASALMEETMGSIADEGLIDFEGLQVSEEDEAYDAAEAGYLASLEGMMNGDDSQFKEQPDILLKTVIDKYHGPYTSVVQRYIMEANDLAEKTGRYDVNGGDLITIPSLISMKDLFAQKYLRAANDALEKKFDEIIDKIDTPLKFLESSHIRVWNTENGYGNGVSGTFKNHYKDNGEDGDGKMYVNGISSDFLTTPKQCYPYLGSDYTEVSNDFSTITRSISSDSILTAQTRYGLGVNGFTLPATEAFKKTDGMVSHGLVIDDRPEYGLPAFYNDSPLEKHGVEKGDIIYAVKPSFNILVKQPGQVHMPKCDLFGSNSVQSGAETLIYSQKNLDDAIDDAYRKVQNKTKYGGQDEEDMYCKTSQMAIYYYDVSEEEPAVFEATLDFDVGDKDLVPVYALGKASHAYKYNDLKGCFYSSTILHDDRCFPRIATYPVLDPAGSYEPYYDAGVLFFDKNGAIGLESSTDIWRIPPFDYPTGDDARLTYLKGATQGDIPEDKVFYEHQFPVGSNAISIEKDGGPRAYWHKEMFQLPEGREFSDIDEIYMDGCFDMMADYEIPSDLNPGLSLGEEQGAYNLVQSLTEVYTDDSDNDDLPYGGNGPGARPNIPIIDTPDAFPVTDEFTLEYFAKHYGLYDGIDNDGDGDADYYEKDTNSDGVMDIFKFDKDEADEKYGLDPNNIMTVSRKILGHNYKWVPPESLMNELGLPENEDVFYYPFTDEANFSNTAYTYFQFSGSDADYVMEVKPKIYETEPGVDKIISSLIRHNEPTNYTIARQWEAKMSLSLPIDDPRSVSFMAADGEMYNVEYPNLFKLGRGEMLHDELQEIVDYLLEVPGAADKFTGSELDKKNYIINELKSVTTNSPEEKYELKDYQPSMISADPFVVRDAITWLGYSVDDKHEYVLKYYLNEGKDAFVNDSELGYEAAYLVFDGGSLDGTDYVDSSFDRPLLEESDPSFNMYAGGANYEDYVGEEVDDDGYEKDPVEDDDFVFVPLSEFYDELIRFKNDLGKFVEDVKDISLSPVCGPETSFEDEDEDLVIVLKVDVDKDFAQSGGNDSINVTVGAFGEDDEVMEISRGLLVELAQDDAKPVLELREFDIPVMMTDGVAKFVLKTTDNGGPATLNVSMGERHAPGIKLKTSENYINLVSPVDVLTAGSGDEITISAQMMKGENPSSVSGNEVQFVISDGSLASFVGSSKAVTENGRAEITIKAKNKSEYFDISATIPSDNSFADGYKEFYVAADEPAKVALIASSDVLEANGQSYSDLTIKLYDQYSNPVSHSFEKVSVFAIGDAVLDDSQDTDPAIPGVQLDASGGVANVTLTALEETGSVDVYAVLQDIGLEDTLFAALSGDEDEIDFTGTVGSSKTIKIMKGLKMQVVVENGDVLAGSTETAKMKASLTDSSGKIQSGYNGDISFRILDPGKLRFKYAPEEVMSNGERAVMMVPTTSAGKVQVEVSAPGFASHTASVEVVPDVAASMRLTSDKDIIYTTSVDGTNLKLELLDQYENIATTSSAPIQFKATDATKHLVNIIDPSSTAVSATGTAKIKSTGVSGTVNLYVTSATLGKAILSLDVKKRIEHSSYDEFAPNALYLNLLGGSYFDLGQNDLGPSMLYNGKAQAVLTTTSSVNDKSKSIYVDGYGYMEVLDANISTEMVIEDGLPRVKFFDIINEETIGSAFVVPGGTLGLDVVESFDEHEEGILAMSLVEGGGSDDGVRFELSGDGFDILLIDGNKTVLSVDRYGKVIISDESVRLVAPGDDVDSSYFSFLVAYGNLAVGQVMYKQNGLGGVKILHNDYSTLPAGTYLQVLGSGNYRANTSYSKYSTEFDSGAYLVNMDRDIDPAMAPGFGFSSVDNAQSDEGVGFRYDNKNLLFFAAANSVGESNMPYASEVGVVLGDPTVRLDRDSPTFSEMSGYARTIGQPLFASEQTIKQIKKFDYNGDGFEDLLLLYDSGDIRLMENEVSNQKYKDRGLLLHIANGVRSMATLDFNNDGFDDLILGTEESCKQSEVCLYAYINEAGHFVREQLKFEGIEDSSRIYEMKTGDLNDDGYPDLLITNDGGDLIVYWNGEEGLDGAGDSLGNFGLDVSSGDLTSNLVVNYSGMPDREKENTGDFIQMNIAKDHVEGSEDNFPELEDFIAVKKDPRFVSGSKKTIIDVNGGSLGLGDTVQYQITLKNNSGSAVSGLMLSDLMPKTQSIDLESLTCSDPGCGDDLRWSDAYGTNRPLVIKGVSVSAGSSRTIAYKASITSTPNVSFEVGNYEDVADGYLDIMVRPDFGGGNEITYFDSGDQLEADGRVDYLMRSESAVFEAATNEFMEGLLNGVSEGIGLADGVDDSTYDDVAAMLGSFGADDEDEECDENSEGWDPDDETCVGGYGIGAQNEVPDELQDVVDQIDSDKNQDGIPDLFGGSGGSDGSFTDSVGDAAGAAVDLYNQYADEAIGAINDAVNAFRCGNVGCIPTPYNYAFFAPSKEVPGTALFAAGTPAPPFFSFMYPSRSASTFRFYLSPTLTMGLGVGFCTGPNDLAGTCIPATIPMDFVTGGICDAIQQGITSVVNEAKDFVTSTVNDVTAAITDGYGPMTTEQQDHLNEGVDASQSETSWGGGSSPLMFEGTSNVHIPGFPGVLTEWLDNQIEEIFNKLLDLPDFYLILPDVESLVSETATSFSSFGDIESYDDFVTVIQQIPLIQIRGEEVMLKIPSINQDEMTKWKRQAELFVKNIENTLERMKNWWYCEDDVNKTVCDILSFKMTALIGKVEQALETIESYKNLPKQILEWRHLQQKYALQIVCYLDKVMDLTGGYIKKQSRVIASWMKTIDNIVQMFKSWAAIFDLTIEYQESCDECRNERFSLLGLLIETFFQIPSPPVVQIPKWPDFIFDMSKLELGVEIIWPDIVFKPQPIKLPDLPSISFPFDTPEVVIDLDGLIPDFDIPLPRLFQLDLPDLPPLPLPKLPDLPKPPKIPVLPKAAFDAVINVKKIFKILCLIKKGLMPIPEITLQDQFQRMTNPSVKAQLPFMMGLGVELPGIEYDAPVAFEFTLKTKFGVGTNAIYQSVKDVADEMNRYVEEYVKKINNYTTRLKVPYVEDASLLWKEKLNIPPKFEIDGKAIKDAIKEKSESNAMYYLAADVEYIDADSLEGHDIDDLDFRYGEFEKDSYMARLSDVRNDLLAYAGAVDKGNGVLDGMNGLDEFTKFIADNSSRPNIELAANGAMRDAGGLNEGDGSAGGLGVIRTSMVDEDKLESNRLVAAGIDFSAMGIPDLGAGGVSSPTPPGMHVFMPDGSTENVLFYTDELTQENHLEYIDVDNDGDEDIIYSMRGDLYLKENYSEDDGPALGKVTSELSKSSVSSYGDEGVLSVQMPRINDTAHNFASIDFVKSTDESIVGYEVMVIPSLLDMDNNTYNGSYRFALFEDSEGVFGSVDNVVGLLSNNNDVVSHERDVYTNGGEFTATGLDVVHAKQNTRILLEYSETSKTIEINSGEIYIIESYVPSAEITVVLGEVEHIKHSGDTSEYKLIEDMALTSSDVVVSGENGGASVVFSNGAAVVIESNEEFKILELKNPENPKVDIEVPDGNYYSIIYALTNTGKRSYASTQTPIAPQICGDDDPPIDALSSSNTQRDVAVTKTLEIDASASFDPNGEIKMRYIDSNILKDSDGDGDPMNDVDPSDPFIPNTQLWKYKEGTNDVFKFGPFEEIYDYKVALNIMDLSDLVSTQLVDINVYVPAITLDGVNEVSQIVTGSTDPASSDMPFALVRDRFVYRVLEGELVLVPRTDMIVTPSSDEYGQYRTDTYGEYKVTDFTVSKLIEILGSDGEVVGEIHSETGNLWVDDGYEVVIHTSAPPVGGTYVEIIDPNGNSMGTIQIVSNANNGSDIVEEVEFDSENFENYIGVTVSDLNVEDEFEFMNYPPNDPNYPNGIYLLYVNENKQVMAIDTTGNVLVIDDRFSLQIKDNHYLFDPLVYEVWFDDEKIAEIYVSPFGLFDEAQIVGTKDVPYQYPNGITPQYLYTDKELSPVTGPGGPLNPSGPMFSDLSGNLYDYAMSLYRQGLLDGGDNLSPHELLSRGDFVMMLLRMLCIVPRADAYKAPALFDDMPFTSPLSKYYPYIKEGSLLGLVSGYGGETGSSGLNPFKPQGTVNMAEASKVIVEGLEMIGAIDLSDVDFDPNLPWYKPYFEVALNLSKYAKDGVDLKNSFIITEQDSMDPFKQLTRGQIIEMAYRVLDAYNCLEVDKDEDGMSDYCENQYDIDDPEDDPDEDKLSNIEECGYGTNPVKYDTDDGGVGDGDEVEIGTHPLNGEDDFYDTDGDGLLDVEEILIYHTDPNNPDTDGGGVYDGTEVERQTDPLGESDDYVVGEDDDDSAEGGQELESQAGIYLVPAECSTCPCNNSYNYKSDLRKGDVLYTIIVNQDGTRVYTKSNEVKIK